MEISWWSFIWRVLIAGFCQLARKSLYWIKPAAIKIDGSFPCCVVYELSPPTIASSLPLQIDAARCNLNLGIRGLFSRTRVVCTGQRMDSFGQRHRTDCTWVWVVCVLRSADGVFLRTFNRRSGRGKIAVSHKVVLCIRQRMTVGLCAHIAEQCHCRGCALDQKAPLRLAFGETAAVTLAKRDSQTKSFDERELTFSNVIVYSSVCGTLLLFSNRALYAIMEQREWWWNLRSCFYTRLLVFVISFADFYRFPKFTIVCRPGASFFVLSDCWIRRQVTCTFNSRRSWPWYG